MDGQYAAAEGANTIVTTGALSSGSITAGFGSIDAKIFTVKNETKIFVEKSNFDIQVASINNYNFYKTLKDKLLWGKDKRN